MTLREMTSCKLKVIGGVALCLVIAGCLPSEQGATSESQQLVKGQPFAPDDRAQVKRAEKTTGARLLVADLVHALDK